MKKNKIEVVVDDQATETCSPVCPYCKTEMKPISFSGYYDEFNFWQCECEDIPNAKKEYGEYV